MFPQRLLIAASIALLALLPHIAAAQGPRVPLAVDPDTSMRQRITLTDGSTVLGRIVAVWDDSVRVEAPSGTTVIRRDFVRAVRSIPSSSLRDGKYWPEDPNATRLFFGPTARMLRPGEGYLSNHWLFLLDGYVGVTDRFSIGAAITLLPASGRDFFRYNTFFVSPKVSVVQAERFNVAVGALAGLPPFADDATLAGIGYGALTSGGRDGAVTVGVGYGFFGGDIADRPVVMLGGTKRVSMRASLVTENWFFPGVEEPMLSGGLRFHGESLSFDLPGAHYIEVDVPEPVRHEVTRRGVRFHVTSPWYFMNGAFEGIAMNAAGNATACADPRRTGHAEAV
jgi:hypothetical protein